MIQKEGWPGVLRGVEGSVKGSGANRLKGIKLSLTFFFYSYASGSNAVWSGHVLPQGVCIEGHSKTFWH